MRSRSHFLPAPKHDTSIEDEDMKPRQRISRIEHHCLAKQVFEEQSQPLVQPFEGFLKQGIRHLCCCQVLGMFAHCVAIGSGAEREKPPVVSRSPVISEREHAIPCFGTLERREDVVLAEWQVCVEGHGAGNSPPSRDLRLGTSRSHIVSLLLLWTQGICRQSRPIDTT